MHISESKKGEIKNHKKEEILYLLQYLKKYKILLIGSLLAAMVSVILSLYIPIIIGRSVDAILDDKISSKLFYYVLQISGATLLIAIMQWCMSLCNNRICFLTSKELRISTFDHLTKITISDADRLSTGDLVSRITNDIDQLTDGLLLFLSQFFTLSNLL